jgi:dolichol-phosphate mannosyltransferase
MIRAVASLPLLENAPLISVVLPLYDEAAVLHTLARRVEAALQDCGCRYEIIFVNDGSRDESPEILDHLARENPHIRVVHFSRNFGHQAAVQAGLTFAEGDAIVVMDSDLQDDPSAIPQFIARWREGYDVVYAVRFNRKENVFKRSLFYSFYRLLNAISDTPIPNDAGNFGLIDRKVAEHIVRMCDRDRFYPGLRRWVGFRQIGVAVERHARHDDRPRVSLRQLWRLAKSAIFSFSSFPLTAFYAIAALSMLACVAVCGFTLYHKLFTGLAAPGWTSMSMVASFFGAINALGIGILGEYVIRIYDQVRARPLYVVERQVNFGRRAEEREPAPLHYSTLSPTSR